MRFLAFYELCQSSYSYLFALLVIGRLCLMMPVLDSIAPIADTSSYGDVKVAENLQGPISASVVDSRGRR